MEVRLVMKLTKSNVVRTLLILMLIVIPLAVAIGRTLIHITDSSANVKIVNVNKNKIVPTPQITPQLLPGSDWPTYLHDIQRTSSSNETILSPVNASPFVNHCSFSTCRALAASTTNVE